MLTCFGLSGSVIPGGRVDWMVDAPGRAYPAMEELGMPLVGGVPCEIGREVHRDRRAELGTSADSGIRLKDGAESATPSTTLTTMPSVLALSSGCYPFCSQMDLSLQNTGIRFRIDGNNSQFEYPNSRVVVDLSILEWFAVVAQADEARLL